MRLTETFDNLIEKLKTKVDYFDENGDLLKSKVIYEAQNDSESILEILLSDEKLTNTYFKTIKDTKIFLKDKFINTINHKEFFPSSYTSFLNYIGLSDGTDYIKKSKNVVLNFPYKDCILEGGQSREEQSLKEFFYNETLANDEVDRLLHPKVFTNIRKYTKDGMEENPTFKHTDNLLIKGNNLIALHSLLKRYEGRVKLIYIDPPYNTKSQSNSFKYNDKFNHSSWLTFIKNRLEISKKLLSNDGFIWITLDDNEAHYFKVIADEIFKNENFIADVIWQSRKSVSNDTLISLSTNHILLYAKNKSIINKNDFRLELDESKFKYDENDGRGKYKADPFDAPNLRPNLTYPIINPNTNEEHYPPNGRCWRTTKEEYDRLLNEDRIIFGQNGKSKPQLKKYLSEETENGRTPTNLWTDLDTTTNATKELEKLFGSKVFNNPKSESLLQRIITLSTNKKDIVMDFFSGSGTTISVAHKLNRQYIGIEQMDYIDKITSTRLKKVIDGEQTSISKEIGWKGGGSFTYMELMKNNQSYIDTITDCTSTSQLIEIKNELRNSNFIRYEVNDENLFDDKNQFDILSINEQKEILIKILDKNHLYVNYSEMDDTQYNISDEVKRFNREFYEVK